MRQTVSEPDGSIPWAKAALAGLAITALLAFLSAQSPLFETIEHWTSDWRTSFFSQQAERQRPDIAVVVIDDETLAGLPYRSPIDRGVMANIVKAIDSAAPRIIALDFLFDQSTEPEKDTALKDALRNANAQIVLGLIDERTGLEAARLAYNRQFIEETGARSGLLNMRIELDGTVRSLPARMPGSTPYFAGAIAEAAGATAPEGRARRIAWLRHPDTEDTFLRIPAHRLLHREDGEGEGLRSRLLALLKDRIVLVGAELTGGGDRFMTPLSRLDGRPMPGVYIHAHAVAQFLDGRRYFDLGPQGTVGLSAMIAFLGFLLGWRHQRSSFLVGLPPILAYLAADIIAFSLFSVILPFALPALAWLLGVFSGQGVRWLSKRGMGAATGTGENA